MNEHYDFILNECDLDVLAGFVTEMEQAIPVRIIKKPTLSLTMIRAEDSVEQQEFYLGEALTTDCEVEVGGHSGTGICLGDQPQRAYCIAFFDALLQYNEGHAESLGFLNFQGQLIEEKRMVEYNHIQRTRVDFKMMEQA
jgi:phosphonate C-P lyase system protein PhnG